MGKCLSMNVRVCMHEDVCMCAVRTTGAARDAHVLSDHYLGRDKPRDLCSLQGWLLALLNTQPTPKNSLCLLLQHFSVLKR